MKINRRAFVKGGVVFAVAPLWSGALAEGGHAPLVRFGVFTDAHYARRPPFSPNDPTECRLYEDALRRIREAVSVFTARNVDFAIELGDFKDLACAGNGCTVREATLKLAEACETAFSEFKGPRYHVLGNHEMDCLNKDEILSVFTNTGIARNRSYYSFRRAGITFIVLDGCYNSRSEPYCGFPLNWIWTEATIPPEEIAWLRAELAAAPGPVIVFVHQRLDAPARKNHRILNAVDVQKVLVESGKVLAVFQGHDHIGGLSVEDGIPYYTLPALVITRERNAFAEVSVYSSGALEITGFGRVSSRQLLSSLSGKKSDLH